MTGAPPSRKSHSRAVFAALKIVYKSNETPVETQAWQDIYSGNANRCGGNHFAFALVLDRVDIFCIVRIRIQLELFSDT